MQYKHRRPGKTHLHILLVDTSSSAVSGGALENVKGVIRTIAKQAYLNREKLCIIQFGNNNVSLVQPPKRPPKTFLPIENQITAGGGTPLRKALKYTESLFRRWNLHQQHLERSLYLFTDGRTNDRIEDIKLSGQLTVVDTESTVLRLGRSEQIAAILGADYVHLERC